MACCFMTHCDWGSLNNLPKVARGVDRAGVFVGVIDSTTHTHAHIFVRNKKQQTNSKTKQRWDRKLKVSDSTGRAVCDYWAFWLTWKECVMWFISTPAWWSAAASDTSTSSTPFHLLQVFSMMPSQSSSEFNHRQRTCLSLNFCIHPDNTKNKKRISWLWFLYGWNSLSERWLKDCLHLLFLVSGITWR